ncbi:MAG: hypothetical protein ACE14V_15960 [bacterium]
MLNLATISKALFLFLFLGQIVSLSIADTITTSDGTRLTCVIVMEDAKTVVVETRFGSMSFHRKVIRNIDRDSNEYNLILRSDFSIARKDFNTAMKYLQDAMIQYPGSQAVREKYRQLRDAMDKSSLKELTDYGKKDEQEKKVTDENAEVAKTHLKSKKDQPVTTLILYGFGSYPIGKEYERSAEKVIELAKLDALEKAFGEAVGTGFTLKKGKLKILPPGELPNCKMKILDKQKIEDAGYAVKLQVQCPASSLLFKIPDDTIEQEAVGSVALEEKKKKEYRSIALEQAYRQAVLGAISSSPQYRNNPELSGRIFLIDPPEGNIIAGFYQVKIKVKIWFEL